METRTSTRRRRAALLLAVGCYALVAAAATAVAFARRAKDLDARTASGPRILRTIPAALPVGVPERLEILGAETRFDWATTVRLGAAGATCSKVRLLALDRIEVSIFVPEGAEGRGGRGPLPDLPITVRTPLREGGEEAIEYRLPLTREYRPISLDLVSFGGRERVEVRRPFVMVGYRAGGHPPFHVEIENLRTGGLYVQEVSEDFEQRGIPVLEGENLISVRLLDAARREVRKEVAVTYEPEGANATFISFQGALSSYPYNGDPVQWPPTSNPPDDSYIPPEQPVCCGCGCLGNGLQSSAFGTSLVGLTPPPNGDAKDCEPGVSSSEGGGAEGWDGQWHDLIAGVTGNGAGKGLAGGETKGVGVGIAGGSGGGVVPTTGQWRSEPITDVASPGRGLDFKFVRRYHSDRRTDGYLGKGWDFNYGAKFEVYQDPYGVPVAGLFSRGDYRRDKFSEPDLQGGEYVYLSHDSNPSFERVSTIPAQGISKMVKRNGFTQEFDLVTGLLKKRKDRYGNAITVNYDYSGRIAFVYDASGRVHSFSYYTSAEFGGQFEGRLKRISSDSGSVTYEYVRNGADVYLSRVRRAPVEWVRDTGDPENWQTVTEAAGQDYEYDANGGLTVLRDGRGNVALLNEYDSLDPAARVSAQWHYGKLHTYAYDVPSPESGDTDTAGVRHRAPGLQGAQEDAGMYWFLDDAARLPRRLLFKGPGGLPPDNVYFDLFPGAPCPEPSRAMGPDGKTVGLVRDAKGNITEKRFYKNRGTTGGPNPAWPSASPEDVVVSAEYQTASEYGSGVYGAMTAFVDPLGRRTTIQYDPERTADPVRILAPDTTDPDGQTQTGHREDRTYNAYGQLLWREILDGNRSIRVEYQYYGSYPGAGRLDAMKVKIGDAQYLTTSFSYNLWGDLVAVTDPMGRTWQYEVNSERLVTQVLLPPVAAEGNAQTKVYYTSCRNLPIPVSTVQP